MNIAWLQNPIVLHNTNEKAILLAHRRNIDHMHSGISCIFCRLTIRRTNSFSRHTRQKQKKDTINTWIMQKCFFPLTTVVHKHISSVWLFLIRHEQLSFWLIFNPRIKTGSCLYYCNLFTHYLVLLVCECLCVNYSLIRCVVFFQFGIYWLALKNGALIWQITWQVEN